MRYATFWQRFGAMWVDALVFLPLSLIYAMLQGISKGSDIFLTISLAIAFQGYTIYYHGKYGQTIGKRVMAIRVVQTTGTPIGWREAWWRSSVDVAFAIVGALGSVVALMTITDTEYYGADGMQRAENLEAHEPPWLAGLDIAELVWVWSELVVMLLNQHRRALHDFMAGTVVIADPPKGWGQSIAPQDLPPDFWSNVETNDSSPSTIDQPAKD